MTITRRLEEDLVYTRYQPHLFGERSVWIGVSYRHRTGFILAHEQPGIEDQIVISVQGHEHYRGLVGIRRLKARYRINIIVKVIIPHELPARFMSCPVWTALDRFKYDLPK